ncbi:MAG: STAS domain-containing protein [Betaproteobacteria bacterium]|nr:STAS domain-containing protein [Betaproteobacteria bacterium]
MNASLPSSGKPPPVTPSPGLPRQTDKSLSGDLWGGTAAMLVALPSAIAFGVAIYAPMGGALGPQGAVAGILGAIALGLVAPLLGGSSRLITAPCAPAAAVLSALAMGFAGSGMQAEQVLTLIGLIGLMAGLIQIALGLAGIGKLIKFIPFPVVSGYLSGVGLIIIGSQVPKFLGVTGAPGLIAALSHPGGWVWQSALIGSTVIAAMVAAPRLTKVVPATIIALLSGLACYGLLGMLGQVPMHTESNRLLIGPLTSGGASLMDTLGLRLPKQDLLTMSTLVTVLVPSLTLAVLLSIDTLKTCLVIDAMTNTHHNSNRELVGQGASNMLSSLVGGIPGAGTMGASLINISSGGNTKLSGFVSGVAALLALWLLAPLIAWVPLAALAGILMVTGMRMIDRRSLSFFFTPATRLDFVVILSVILVALFGNLIAASGVGVALAILLYIREQTRVSVVRNRIDGQTLFAHRPGANTVAADSPDTRGHDAVVFELQGSLFFGTASQLQSALEPETGSRKYVILSMRRVQSLDVTATHVLEQIKDRLEEHDAYLVFCDIPKDLPSGLKMKRFLKDTGVVRPTNKAFAFKQLEDALEWVEARELTHVPSEVITTESLDLSAMPALAGCSAQDLAALEGMVHLQTIAAGKKLFKHDKEDDSLYFVRSGLVKLSVSMQKKETLQLMAAAPGDLLCTHGFLQSPAAPLDALALLDAEVYALTRGEFDLLVMSHPAIANAIHAALVRSQSAQLQKLITELRDVKR